MKIIIIGSGVAGSVLADLLSEENHEVVVLEREKRPGGMCKSYYKQGFTYEYGPHILAMHNCSAKASAYIQSKISTYKTQLTTASSVGGKLTFYPPSIYSADRLGIGEQVRAELEQRPEVADESNFETYPSNGSPKNILIWRHDWHRVVYLTQPKQITNLKIPCYTTHMHRVYVSDIPYRM